MEKLKIYFSEPTGLYYFNLFGLTVSFSNYKIFDTDNGLAIFFYFNGEAMASIYKRSNEPLFNNIHNQLTL